MDEDFNFYMDKLLAQDNVTICPACYPTGYRERFCNNFVLNRKDKSKGFTNDNIVLVCCYIGNEAEQDTAAWETKVADMQKRFNK